MQRLICSLRPPLPGHFWILSLLLMVTTEVFAGGTSDAYFLSLDNPIATADQRYIEERALRIAQMPAVRNAKQTVAARWKVLAGSGASDEAWSRFDAFMDEWVFGYSLKAVNSDANHPRILAHSYAPAHGWFNMDVPGSRAGGAGNPDNIHALAPIDGVGSFEFTGKQTDWLSGGVAFNLVSDTALTTTLARLDGKDLLVNPGGSFVITLDPAPANGRANHIQTKPGTKYLLSRDTRGDWSQKPGAYQIKRTSPPSRPPLSDNQIAQRAADYMIGDVPKMYKLVENLSHLNINRFTPPFGRGDTGGAINDMASFGRLNLGEEDAFLVTVNTGGASYHSLVLYDYWLRTFDYWQNTSSLNNRQSVSNADGTVTYVISIKDPGVHNWLNTEGFREVNLLCRWQGLSPERHEPGKAPAINGELVKLSQLKQALPEGTKFVSESEREQQLKQRRQEFALQFVDD